MLQSEGAREREGGGGGKGRVGKGEGRMREVERKGGWRERERGRKEGRRQGGKWGDLRLQYTSKKILARTSESTQAKVSCQGLLHLS